LNAIATGRYEDEIVPVPVKKGKIMVDFAVDEFPTASTLEALGSLKPAFKKDGTVTAGNSSGRNDGAAAMVLMDREKAFAIGIAPMMRSVSYASVGVPPEIMGIGPVPATLEVLERASLTMQDIDLIELNEAFAAQSLGGSGIGDRPLQTQRQRRSHRIGASHRLQRRADHRLPDV
jgi:acetyl-CoA C-acetyltransferase